MNSRSIAILLGGVFVIALAVQVANRLSNDSLNFAIGALCGAVVSLPVSFGLMLAVYRRQAAETDEIISAAPVTTPVTLAPEPMPVNYANPAFPNARNPYRQIIVVSPTPGAYPNSLPYSSYFRPNLNPAPEEAMQERNWRIIGEEGD